MSIKTTPYHPEYGLTDDIRREALRTADLVSVRVAASIYRVSTTSIYNWRRDYASAINN
jgi:transposase-like protein